jgi:hypothetical protein
LLFKLLALIKEHLNSDGEAAAGAALSRAARLMTALDDSQCDAVEKETAGAAESAATDENPALNTSWMLSESGGEDDAALVGTR